MGHPYILGEDIKELYNNSWEEKKEFINKCQFEYDILKNKGFITNITNLIPSNYVC